MVYTLWPKRKYRALLPAPQLAPQLKNMTFVQLEALRGVHTRRGANWGQHRDRQGHSMQIGRASCRERVSSPV